MLWVACALHNLCNHTQRPWLDNYPLMMSQKGSLTWEDDLQDISRLGFYASKVRARPDIAGLIILKCFPLHVQPFHFVVFRLAAFPH